ncbi:hypothetical protein H4F33_00850 [Pectobacterium brasiliense]|uniref:Aldose 1-epimerase n=1 Tax=Pectobacterium brasiliense TaxID=180957 RepID=A0AAE3BGI7_9GAMM|nr:hypothetical protein [Pectobacterium brasiliense]MBA0217247.1 hypothetical protein [Pectobacterium brasiliense]MBN3052585.1 hypothetical protein [Pectobacterium brasiliense]MBN3070696.1 hypothetical protein [Pectobacterium brasiliense]MBN3169602.1 hypothetical protein [Pectobacterium brasiliense]
MPSQPHLFSLTSHDGQLAATLSTAGGILTSLRYKTSVLPPREVLYRAPWLDDVAACANLPPLMQRLAGEWVAVPFGHSSQDGEGFFHHASHGLPVNGEWQVTSQKENVIQLQFLFAEDFPLTRLTREVTLQDDGRACFRLIVEARRECRFPIGLHPIFPIGNDAGDVILTAENMQSGLVYPEAPEPGISQLRPLARFNSLATVPTVSGNVMNLQRLPLAEATEEIVQLLSPVSAISLHYPAQQHRVTLRWDTQSLPHCLLWFSNGGRAYAPWNGRNRCLGVEPICSAWDLGPKSLKENPIAAQGYATNQQITPENPLKIDYQLHCQPA